MDRERIKQYLSSLGVPHADMVDGDEWVRCPCVLAPWTHDSGKDSSPSFGVKVLANKESFFHCYSCESGDLVDLVYQLRDRSKGANRYDYVTALKICEAEMTDDIVLSFSDDVSTYNAPDTLYSEIWWQKNFKPAVTVEVARNYLRGRGLTDKIINELDIRYDGHRNIVVFPIRNSNAELAQVRGRRIDPQGDAPRYHVYKTGEKKYTKNIWYGEEWLNPDEPVLMVESVFDLASAYREYKNVIAPLSVGISRDCAYRVSECSEIVTMFDLGKGGDKARNKIDLYFPDAIITHLLPSEGCKDAGDMTCQQMFEALEFFLPMGTPV